MDEEQIKQWQKLTNENIDSAIKLIEINKKTQAEKEDLERRLKDAAEYIRKHIYSITTEKKRINRLDLKEKEYNDLMKLLEK